MGKDSDPTPVEREKTASRPSRRPRAIRVEAFAPGQRTDLFVRVSEWATGQPVLLPVVVARGARPGPTVGVCAAVHGNELNGVRIIHSLLQHLDLETLQGSLLCAPIVNVPAFKLRQRAFPDGRDLNHCFPGNERGEPAAQYARAFLRTFLPPCNYLVDIHTASEGRVNSFYVRADLRDAEVRLLAERMNAEILLHARGGDGTLRHAARQRGVPAITVEAGNPDVFQGRMVFQGEAGLLNVLAELGLREETVQPPEAAPVVCQSSRWLRTTSGGLLNVHVGLRERVRKGQLLAQTVDPFGAPLTAYSAPVNGVVIGLARSPLAVPGTRYCHLGVVGEPDAGTLGAVDDDVEDGASTEAAPPSP